MTGLYTHKAKGAYNARDEAFKEDLTDEHTHACGEGLVMSILKVDNIVRASEGGSEQDTQQTHFKKSVSILSQDVNYIFND